MVCAYCDRLLKICLIISNSTVPPYQVPIHDLKTFLLLSTCTEYRYACPTQKQSYQFMTLELLEEFFLRPDREF